MGQVVIFSAPSGSGKTTIVHRLLARYPQFEFSVSATSRAPRGTERDGVDYYFLTQEAFRKAVAEGRFVEWEEVYQGTCYGTLRSEVERIWDKGHIILFDVDVMGGINLKRIFGADACSIFIMPPSIEELRRRLEGRGTDTPEVIERRVAKAEFELTKAPEFDHYSTFQSGSFQSSAYIPLDDGRRLSTYLCSTAYNEMVDGREVGGFTVREDEPMTTRSYTAADGTELTISQNSTQAIIYAYLDKSYITMTMEINNLRSPGVRETDFSLDEDTVNYAADFINYKNIGK